MVTTSLKMNGQITSRGPVYCPLCTHTVEADILFAPKGSHVKPGQKCPRCASSLDAGCVLRFDRAA
jgi:hypothetical protein